MRLKTKNCWNSLQIRQQKMEEKAIEMNADAIVGIRYSTCNLVDGAAEIIVYGTAVKCI